VTVLALKFFDECCNEPAKPWLIKGVMAMDEDSTWFGPPGSLKSTLLVDLAIHLAAGKNWRGFKTKVQTGIVYFALERASLTRRGSLSGGCGTRWRAFSASSSGMAW
jgi:RecA-family ATPase